MTPDDFWIVMKTAIKKRYSEYNQEQMKLLKNLMNMKRWHIYCPILEVMRNYAENYMNITISNYDTIKQYNFIIPITFTTQNKLEFMNLKSLEDERLIFIRRNELNKTITIRLIEDGWVMFNLKQTGKY